MTDFQQVPQSDYPPTKIKKPWYKKFWAWVAIVVLIIIIVVNMNKGGDASTEAASAPAQKTTAPAEPPMVVTATQMEDALKGNALKAQTTYDNKRVQVTGYVDNIDAQGKYFSIVGTKGDFVLTGVTIDITKDQKATVANFDKDQKVVVTGTVTDVGELMGIRVKAETIK